MNVQVTTHTRSTALLGQTAGLSCASASFFVARNRDRPRLNYVLPTCGNERRNLSKQRHTDIRWQSPFSFVHYSSTLPFETSTPCSAWPSFQSRISIRSVSDSPEVSPNLLDSGRYKPRAVVPPRRRVLSFGPFIIITAVTTAAFFRRYVACVHSTVDGSKANAVNDNQ